jgi:hypothetical protein
MPEKDFVEAYDMEYHKVQQHAPADWYAFKDNGSKILFVAHLDTVSWDGGRACRFVQSEAGLVVFSRSLDDRLGAYVGLDLLPKLGIVCDILLTVGEESGQSTAGFFETDKEYNWIIEFDRGGTDVVLYQYEDDDTKTMVRETGATVGDGIFSDISVMEDLGIKAFNWGVGYQDYHSSRSHAFLEDTWEMVSYFMDFHETWHDVRLDHEEARYDPRGGWGRHSGWLNYGSGFGTECTTCWELKAECVCKKDDPESVERAAEAADIATWWAEQQADEWADNDTDDAGHVVSDDQALVNSIILQAARNVQEMPSTDREAAI